MAEESSQERTEEATPRRKQQARERGQVATSRELNSMLMLLTAGGAALLLGPFLVENLLETFRAYLGVDRQVMLSLAICNEWAKLPPPKVMLRKCESFHKYR